MDQDPQRPLGRLASIRMGWLRKKSLSERKAHQLDVLSTCFNPEQDSTERARGSQRGRSKSFSAPPARQVAEKEELRPFVQRHPSIFGAQARRSTKALALEPEAAASEELLERPRPPGRQGLPSEIHDRLSTIAVVSSPPTSLPSSLGPSLRPSVRMSIARTSVAWFAGNPDGVSSVALPASLPPSHRPSERLSVFLRPSIAAIPPRSSAYDRLSTLAVLSSPPESLGSELPTARTVAGQGGAAHSTWGGPGQRDGPANSPPQQPQSGGDGSPPGTAASHATYTSQHSANQASSLGSFSFENAAMHKRRQSNNFFKGDITSSSHQLKKASILASKQAKAGSDTLRLAYRSSRRGSRDTVSSEGRQSWASAADPAVSGQSGSSLGAKSLRDRNLSALDKLRAGISPAAIKRMVTNQSGYTKPMWGMDARSSVASSSSDLHSVLSLGGQVLEAASAAFRDDYQRRSIMSMLGGDNLNKRVAWMNRVLGTQYVDGDMGLEEEDDSHKNDVMFHPNSPFRARWDIVVIVVIFYQIALMPVRVVWGDNKIGMLFFIEMLLSVLLSVDVVFSFHTGCETEGDIVMDKTRVRRHYLSTWFVPELISSLPYDILAVLAQGEDPKSYRAISLRAVRFLALLRWPRLWRYITKWQDMLAMDSVLLKLFKYWLALIMFVHAGACMAALQAFLQRNNPASFFNRTDFTSPLGDPPALMDRNPFVQYVYSLFRSVSGTTAVGWGMSNPQPAEEVFFMTMLEGVGSAMMLVFQAAILTLVRTYDKSASNYMQRTEMIKDFFSRYDIPQDIRKRTMIQQLARHTNRRLMRDDLLLKDLSPSMRVDLQVHLASTVLRLQPIFSTWRPVVARAVAAELVQGRFAPGDTIFYKGEMADCMYFVAEGMVRIVDPDDNNKLLTTITRGSYFGEFALLQGERGVRTASAEAAAMTLLFSLSRKTFYRIAAHYPEMLDTLNIIAAARAAVNSHQALNTQELLRIKASRSSFLMTTCRAAVAQAIMEEEDEDVGEAAADKVEAEAFDDGPAAG